MVNLLSRLWNQNSLSVKPSPKGEERSSVPTEQSGKVPVIEGKDFPNSIHIKPLFPRSLADIWRDLSGETCNSFAKLPSYLNDEPFLKTLKENFIESFPEKDAIEKYNEFHDNLTELCKSDEFKTLNDFMVLKATQSQDLSKEQLEATGDKILCDIRVHPSFARTMLPLLELRRQR